MLKKSNHVKLKILTLHVQSMLLRICSLVETLCFHPTVINKWTYERINLVIRIMIKTKIIQIPMVTTNKAKSLIRTLSLSKNYPRKKKNKRMIRKNKDRVVIHKEIRKWIISIKIIITIIMDNITLLLLKTSHKAIFISFYQVGRN